MKYWICKAKYKEETPEGKLRQATYEIIVESTCYTDSEARATEIIRETLRTDIDSLDIKPTRLTEIFRDPGEVLLPWFKAAIHILGYDDDKRKAINKDVQVLVQGEDIPGAIEALLKHFKSEEIRSIETTAITDVYPAGESIPQQQPRRSEEEVLIERFGKENYDLYKYYGQIACPPEDRELLQLMESKLGKFTSGTTETEYINKARALKKEYAPNMGDMAGIFPALAINNILNP